jgi:hypothetical protein
MLKRSRKQAALALALSMGFFSLQMSPASASTAAELQEVATELQAIATELNAALTESTTVVTLLNLRESATAAAAALTIANTESATAAAAHVAANSTLNSLVAEYGPIFNGISAGNAPVTTYLSQYILNLSYSGMFDAVVLEKYELLSELEQTELDVLTSTNSDLLHAYAQALINPYVGEGSLVAPTAAAGAALELYNVAQAAFDLATIDPENANAFILISEAYTAQEAANEAQAAADAAQALVDAAIAAADAIANDSVAIAARERAAREAAINLARQNIVINLASKKSITSNELIGAGLLAKEIKDMTGLNAALNSLSAAQKGELDAITIVVKKFDIVDKIASKSSVMAHEVVSVGLISPESKSKTLIMRELKALTADKVDTIEEIQAVVAAVEAKAAARKKAIKDVAARISAKRAA